MIKKQQLKKRPKNSGFTIVELLMSLLIFSFIASTLYSLLSLSDIIMRTHDVQARISYDGLQVLRTVNRELTQTSYTSDRLVLTTDGNGNTIARFQIPVDYDNDGDVAANDLIKSIEWGAYDKGGDTVRGSGSDPLNRWVRYSVTGGQLQREVLDSSLAIVSGLTTIICNDVSAFTITQNNMAATLGLTLSVSDTAGQAGQSRNFTDSFSYRTYLRNVPT